jgi:feruloyl esterase
MSMRCPNDLDPQPANVTSGACLTDGQMATLEFMYSRYRFAMPLANGVSSFGMWVPNTDPGGSGLITDRRYKGQEGAGAGAPIYSYPGVSGVTGFLFRDLRANPLDYAESGPLNSRRVEISAWLDATKPDLTAFARRGGKMIVTIGTNDTQASPGAQLDYYQAVIDTMGRPAVDAFARLFVIPQAGHALTGTSYPGDRATTSIAAAPIPSRYDRFSVLIDWVEKNAAPALTLIATADRASLPLCSYPTYPKYVTGPVSAAASYTCAR